MMKINNFNSEKNYTLDQLKNYIQNYMLICYIINIQFYLTTIFGYYFYNLFSPLKMIQ